MLARPYSRNYDCLMINSEFFHASVSGFFELKIDNSSSKGLTGTANTAASEKETKLDAAFHATLK